MEVMGWIADHPTPKIHEGGAGAAFTVMGRDFKGVMIVVLSNSDRTFDGEQSSGELLRTGCIQRYVRDE